MKTNKTLIKELRQDLHYHQMMVRVDLNTARAGVRKCREIGAKMRALQTESRLTKRAADGGYCACEIPDQPWWGDAFMCHRCNRPRR